MKALSEPDINRDGRCFLTDKRLGRTVLFN